MFRSIATIGFVLFVAVTSQATDIGQIQPLIAQLDDERYAVREKATNRLITIDHETALEAVACKIEFGSSEARARALHVLAMWHRYDDTSREAVKATAKRWQKAKKRDIAQMGAELAAKTTPRSIQQASQGDKGAIDIVGGAITIDSFDTIESVDIAVEEIVESVEVISIIEE